VSESGSFDGRSFARRLSEGPGVYRMLAADGSTLYVGKAANLRKRVASYFGRAPRAPRVAAMIAQVAAIETTLTRTESEALLLENQLIKHQRPRYNILLRDDKSYPYIHLSTDQTFPRLSFHRGARKGRGRYFGPYPGVISVRETLNLLQKLFGIRQCEDVVFRNRSRPCLQHQIGRCSAPCVGLISEADYRADVRRAERFLEGRADTLDEELVRDMDRAAEALDFERAARLRDLIGHLRTVQARQLVGAGSGDFDVIACRLGGGKACVQLLFFRNGMNLGGRAYFPQLPREASEAEVLGAFLPQYYLDRAVPDEILLSHEPADRAILEQALGERRGRPVRLASRLRGDRARYLELARRNADSALASALGSSTAQAARLESLRELLDLDEPPTRMECFDISHTGGEGTVAACVVFDANGPQKALYRRFNIRDVTPGDDYAAMAQALARRYRRVQAGEGRLPDILFVDGGKGQLARARDVLSELGVEGVTMVGVAKGEGRRPGEERLVLESGRVLRPGRASAALHLVQQIRDEAHRFAIGGHRRRREKRRSGSALDQIEGVGPRRRAALLRHFGGLAGVEAAGVDELCRVKGIQRELAERIYAALHGGAT
jgi:excinuclease ABC subunit C